MEYESPESVPPEWQVGDVILNRYEVREKFEGGGMGMVYRVHHRVWDMELAVKAPRADFFQTIEQKENFEREAETWVNLGLHPHIVSCYYVRRLGGIPRLFAEFVPGGTLADWMKDGRLYSGNDRDRTLRVLDVAIQIAWALDYAHEKGLIHQDVKPANVLMSLSGDAKLTDFGLTSARHAVDTSFVTPVRQGQSVWVEGSGYLTPEYAAPEQFRGEALSSRTDAWSWALTVLAMMKGCCEWADGRAGPHILADHYCDCVDSDPIASVLKTHLFGDINQRSGDLSKSATSLLAIYERTSDEKYPRSPPDPHKLTASGLNNKGASYVELSRENEGLACFEKAVEIDSRNPQAHYNSGVTRWRMGDITDMDVLADLFLVQDEQNKDVVDELLVRVALERGHPTKPSSELRRELFLSGLNTITKIDHDSLLLASYELDGVRHLFSVGDNSEACVWADTGELLKRAQLMPPEFHIFDCAATPNGSWILCLYFVCSKCGSSSMLDGCRKCGADYSEAEGWLRIFDAKTMHQVSKVQVHDGRELNVLDNNHFSVGDGMKIRNIPDSSISVALDLTDEATLSRHESSYKFEWYSHNLLGAPHICSSHIVRIRETDCLVAVHGRQIRLWQCNGLSDSRVSPNIRNETNTDGAWKTLQVYRPTSDNIINCLAVSPCGRFVAGGSPVHVWSIDGRLLRVLQLAKAQALSFSNDSAFLVCVDHRKDALQVWDTATWRCFCSVKVASFKHWIRWHMNSLDRKLEIHIATDHMLKLWAWEYPEKMQHVAICRPEGFTDVQTLAKETAKLLHRIRQEMMARNYERAHEGIRTAQLRYGLVRHPDIIELEKHLVRIPTTKQLIDVIFEADLPISDGGVWHLDEKALYNYEDDETRRCHISTLDGGPCARRTVINIEGTQVLSFTEDQCEIIDVATSTSFLATAPERWHDAASGSWLFNDGLDSASELVFRSSVVGSSRLILKTEDGIPPLWYSISDHRHYVVVSTSLFVTFWSLRSGKALNTFWFFMNDEILRHCFGYAVGEAEISENMNLAHFQSRCVIAEYGEWVILVLSPISRFKKHRMLMARFAVRNWEMLNLFDLPEQFTLPLCVQLTDRGSKFIAASEDHVVIWDTESGRVLRTFQMSHIVVSIESINCYPICFVGLLDGTVILFDIENEREVRRFKGADEPVRSLSISVDKLRLIVNCHRVFHLMWSFNFGIAPLKNTRPTGVGFELVGDDR